MNCKGSLISTLHCTVSTSDYIRVERGPVCEYICLSVGPLNALVDRMSL